MVEYFPNSDQPVPAILNELEAIRYLRLDEASKNLTSARRALRRLVETKRIRPARIGLLNRYAKAELTRFVLYTTELAGECPGPSEALSR